MKNKFLAKIAEAARISEKLEDPDYLRAGAKAGLYGVVGAGLGHAAEKALGVAGGRLGGLAPLIGAGVGLRSGVHSSYKSQLREQQTHDIKMQGAAQRNELHNLRVNAMQKHAEMDVQLKKDAINLGVIAGLGTMGNLAIDRVIPKAVQTFPKIRRGLLVGGLGMTAALATDYAGIKANNAINKQIDNK